VKKIALLSNVTVGMLVAKLKKKYNVYVPNGYDVWINEIIDNTSNLYNDNYDIIIVLIDGMISKQWNLKQAYEFLELWSNSINQLANKVENIPIFISTIIVQESQIKTYAERKYYNDWESKWYDYIQQIVETKKNVYIFDVAQLIRSSGIDNFYSNKMWYMGNSPYSKLALDMLDNEITNIMNTCFETRKKAIALDLDNTLWGGIVGEDGAENIQISEYKEGQRYYDLQRKLLEMKKRGVLLTILSKNNESDVKEVWETRPSMLLKENDFAVKKINWNDKSQNYIQMIKEMNLTEGSFLFLDDNPVEREAMKMNCSDVEVIDFPEDTCLLEKCAEDFYKKYFRQLRTSSEDAQKTNMYQAEIKRNIEKQNALSTEDYLKNLNIKVEIHPLNENEITRVAQLCTKTNQFNLTSIRYTFSDIKKMYSDAEYMIYTVYMKDKYGDSGLISVIILHKQSTKTFNIDLFLMSCRVMGRKLEQIIINELINAYCSEIETFESLYIRTNKNKPVENLYENLGFNLLEENDIQKKYRLLLQKRKQIDCYSEIIFKKKDDL